MSFQSKLDEARDNALVNLSTPRYDLECAVEELGDALDEICKPVADLIDEDSYTLYDLEHCLDEVWKLREYYQQSVYEVKTIYSGIIESLKDLIKEKRNVSGDDY